MIEDGDDSADDLNTAAYLALSRVNADPVRWICRLLRSPYEIHPRMRSALADALEGRSHRGSRITFKLQGSSKDTEARWKFQRDISIAEYIDELKAEGLSGEQAENIAADEYRVSTATCHKAYLRMLGMERWLKENLPQRPPLQRKYTDAQWRLHQIIAYWESNKPLK